MSDYGILISDKDSDVNKLENILFSTKYPTVKLDTDKPTSFRDFTLKFTNDPPAPSGVIGDVRITTKVASLPHGYNYIPSSWSLVNVVLPPPSPFYQRYFQEYGTISAYSSDDSAQFYIELDSANVNFYVKKVRFDPGASSNPLIGAILKLRLYIFAEDLN